MVAKNYLRAIMKLISDHERRLSGIKTWLKIVSILMGLLILAAAGLAIWQWDNVHPFLLSRIHDRDTLSERLDQLRTSNKDDLAKDGVDVPNLSSKQVEDLILGEMTSEEALRTLDLDRYQTEEKAKPQGEAEPDHEAEIDELVNRCVAELYQYESYLYGRLGEIRQSFLAVWTSYPPSERTASLKKSLGSQLVSQCYALETSSDSSVSAILDRYRAEVSARGGDSSRIDNLWGVYCSEKASVKAYYFNLL